MTQQPDFEVRAVGRVKFAVTDLETAIAWVFRKVASRTGVAVRLSNAYCVSLSAVDRNYGDLMAEGFSFPDGAPVVATLRALGARGAGRVRGPSLFRSALQRDNGDVRHFFLGAADETLRTLKEVVANEYPYVNAAGYYSPPFGPLSQSAMDDWVSRVADAEATIVWLSLGTPKQDHAAEYLASRLSMPVVAVGAAFDFVAGTTREAPRWMRSAGLEWLFRLVSEPRRLWKRYLFGNARFLTIAIQEVFRQRKTG